MYNEIPYEEYVRDIRELNKEIKEYTKELRTIRTKIYEKCADPGAVQPSLDYNIVEEYVNSLNNEEILTVELFYYERESKIFVFLINTKGKIEIFDKDINNTVLKDSVRKLKTGIDTLNSDIIDKLSVELFNLIFPEDFCKKNLNKPSDTPVMIIPHRELFSIPWEILKNTKSKGNFGGYMGLELQLIRNFSLDLARIMIKKSNKEKGNLLLLFGNPTQNLDGAKKEVMELKESIGDKMPVKLFLEKQIIRDVFKENMGMNDVGIIHYAGHADFLESEPSLSLLLLSDGALTARELGLVKTNNPLFFISACESGQAKGTGGGEVFGIIRGLTLSGSQTIVSTNWQVSDASQKDLAIKFYEKLNDGMTAVSALREARRYNRIKYKDILDWASTTIYGNPLYLLK
jgi:CHAT domain-containing protein